ncbi:MAG: glycohydrolase toxin TNT-related protein [Saprospiraceae bacterium]|nr:glycohydrolase toxin TNT-related protein [Saprospiraceae bacterium]
MKHIHSFFLLLLCNVLLSQSTTTTQKALVPTSTPPVTYVINNDNLNPPIKLSLSTLDGASIRKDPNKTFQYSLHNSKRYNPKAVKSTSNPDKKYLAYTSPQGIIEIISLQDIGRTLFLSSANEQEFTAASKLLFEDIVALAIPEQKEIFNLLASNSFTTKAWMALEKSGYAHVVRTNTGNLKIVSAYFEKYPSHTVPDFKTTTDLFSDKLDYLSILPDIVNNPVVKGSKYEDFVAVSNFDGNFHQSEYSFYLWKVEQWKELEDFFNANKINGGWPPNQGGYYEQQNVPLIKGLRFDRYGSVLKIDSTMTPYEPILTGTFTSPIENGRPYSFGQRALNKPENTYDLYFEIEVLKDLPFTSLDATVIPWFNQVGNGKQAMWNIPKAASGYPMTWNDLVDLDYIIIRIKKSPNGSYSQFANTVLK